MKLRTRSRIASPFIVICSTVLIGLVSPASAKEPITGVYSEIVGAGGLRFDTLVGGHDQLLSMRLIEVADFNFDGVDDLLFGFSESSDSAAAFALGAVGANGAVEFALQRTVFVSDYDALAAGDIDGDGWPEIFSRRFNRDWVEVFSVPQGGSEFGEVYDIPNSEYDESSSEAYVDGRVGLRAGDLDGDGKSDLVMNTTSSSVVIRWSSRPESTEFQTYGVPFLTGQNVLYEVLDYDGDGSLDVLLLDIDTERFVLLRGTGTDSIMLPVVIDIPASGFVAELAYPLFGQFDTDAAVDLVLRDAVGSQTLVMPNFALGIDGPVVLGLLGDERAVEVPGDMDGSGFDDLLVVGIDPDSHAIESIDEPALYMDPLAAGGAVRRVIEVGNLPETVLEGVGVEEDDVRLEMCVGVELNSAAGLDLIWLGGLRPFEVRLRDYVEQDESSTGGSFVSVSPQREALGLIPAIGGSQYEAQNVPTHIVPVDVDDDGVEELVVVGTVSRGKLVDVNDETTVNVSGVNNAWMGGLADLGGDGSPELVFTRVINSLVVVPINADGTLGSRVLFANPNGVDYRSLVVDDFDADGMDDVLAFDQVNSEYHIFRGTGDASVELWSVLDDVSASSNKPASMDFNNDGLPDLVTGAGAGLKLYANNGDGTFTFVFWINAFESETPYWIVTADMDGDGVTDIVSATLGGPTQIHFMGADHEPELLVELSHGNSHNEFEVIAEDLNGDGLGDVLTTYSPTFVSERTVSNQMVWVQVSPRVFMPQGVLPAPDSGAVAASDLNGDGIVDVATASDWDNSVRVHWGAAARCAADLNGDGMLDFFDISELLNTLPDFNGDGAFDFFDISDFLSAFAAGCP